jgi:C-terminal processing protease CtpA/Prc
MLEVTRLPSKQPLPRNECYPLRLGDLILKVDGQLMTELAKLGWQYKQASLRILVLRDGEEVEVEVPLLAAADMNVDEVINFCGAPVQAPNLATRMCCNQLLSEVFVPMWRKGGPANTYDLPINAFITEVGGDPVQTTADFLERVIRVPFGQKFRVLTVDAVTHKEKTVMIEKSVFYPTLLLRRTMPYSTGAIDVTVVDNALWQAYLQKHAGFGGNPPGAGLTY